MRRIYNFKQALSMATLMPIWLLISLPFLAQGQTIKGQVIDKDQPLPSVTILLLAQDSTMIDGTVTDSLGHYSFESVGTGRHLVAASMVGYRTDTLTVVVNDSESISLGNITLEEVATTLGELEL